MTTYPLPTLACTINEFGITAPPYSDIFASLQASAMAIYGADIVVTPDSQDGQYLAVVAAAINDANQVAIAVYNQFSPATSQGVGLSSVVKINGLKRDVATNSTAIVTIVGQNGTVINNGVIGDNQSLGTQWGLPAVVNIGASGTVDVTATSLTPGAVAAAANTLTQILAPSLGWQTVNNVAPAILGAPVETDSQLRQRQTQSTQIPAQSVLGGIYGAVANLTGVTRLGIYENDTSVEDENTLPPHSIAVVVAGGDATTIAQTIEIKKCPGTDTYGSTSEVVTDPIGLPITINFFELETVEVSAVIAVKALAGYVGTTADVIKTVVAAFLTQLNIGEDSYLSRLYSPANLSWDGAPLAAGQTAAQLDALATTFVVLSISQSRSAPPFAAFIVGAYPAGSTLITLTSVTQIFIGSVIALEYLDATYHNFTVTAVNTTTKVVTISPGVALGNALPNNGGCRLVSDVQINFGEAAIAAPSDVTVSAS